jgi:hypothetical protein
MSDSSHRLNKGFDPAVVTADAVHVNVDYQHVIGEAYVEPSSSSAAGLPNKDVAINEGALRGYLFSFGWPLGTSYYINH